VALANCGKKAFNYTGTTLGSTRVKLGGTGTISDSGASVTWTTPPSGAMGDNQTASGTIVAPSKTGGGALRPFVATGTFTFGGEECTVTVTGKVSDPPPTPCTASGDWDLKCPKAGPLAKGSWQ
jgi:hypothetical protein